MKVYHLGSKKVYDVVGTTTIESVANFILSDEKGYFISAPTTHFRKYVEEEYYKRGYNMGVNIKSNDFDFQT